MTSLNHPKNLCLVTLPSPSPSAELAKLQSKLEAVEKVKKLCDFYTNLKSMPNDPKNLLDNLCTRLETFLGFNSASKGYTGSGIVYSDLDRLCDGVMGFLSGVLSNIYSHLGQHKGEITEAIDSLNKNKHAGKNGFNDAIERVVKGVRRYNKEVKKSNAQVKEAVEELQEKVNDAFVDSVKEILKDRFDEENNKIEHTDQEVRAAETFINGKVENCERNASAFKTSLSVHSETVNNFNSVLRDRVRNVDKSVEHEKTRLLKVVDKEKENFSTMEKQVESAMEGLKCNVNKRIKVNVEKLVDELKGVVKQIRDELKRMSTTLSEYIKKLGNWMEAAEQIVENALDKVNEILEEANEGKSEKNPKKIYQAVENIELGTKMLYGQLEGMRDQYVELFVIIKGKNGEGEDEDCVIKKLNDVDQTLSEKVPQRLDEFNIDDGGDWNLQNPIKNLIQKIKTNVGEYVDDLKSILVGGVDKAGSTYSGFVQVSSGHIPALKALHSKLGDQLSNKLGELGRLIDSANNDSVNFGYNIEKVLYRLYQAKTGWIGSPPIDKIYGNLKTALQTKTAEVDNELLQLILGAVINGTGNIQNAVNEIVNQKLQPITNQAQGYVDGANDALNQVIVKANDVNQHLGNLCYAIRNAAEMDPASAKKQLELLKETYFKTPGTDDGKSIKKIYTDISKLQNDLESGPIYNLNYFLTTYADKTCQSIIEPLNKQVNGEIADAQTKIVTAARKQYVTTVQFLIYEFVNKVRSELEGLPTQIAGDLQQGYKGFMTKMEDPFLARLNRIEGVKSDVFTAETSPLKEAATMFKGALTAFFIQLNRQSDLTSDYQKIRPTQKAVEQLLTGLEASRHFDAVFAHNLDALKDTHSRFRATTYGEGKNPYLLESFKKGFAALLGELGKAYISRYSNKTIDWKRITKAEQDKYAKIYLSATPILFSAVKEFVEHLEDEGGKWQNLTMYPSTQSDSSLHALFLNENGYDVGLPVNSSQGTLNHRSDFTGQNVFNHLTGGAHKLFESSDSSIISSALRSGSHVIPVEYTDHEGLIPELYDYLGLYFNVSHLIIHPKPKSPCSIYEMLLWCAGLQFNPVYDKLESYFKELFPKPKELGGEPYSKIDPAQLSFVATTTIQPKQLSAALHEICSQSYAVVTAILGHGHADGLYACDIANNSLTLHYPAVPSQCFDTLVELLLRMYQQLHFLYEQCSRGHVFGAWNKCWYGQGVAGSAATCNDLQCPDQTCNEKHNQDGNQNCKQHADCGLKSPLQWFLEDGLQGFLPHHVTKVGCGITCAMSNHKGIPCRTPMGFSDLSIKASHRQTGKYLEDVLADLCGKPDKPLSQFCSLVTCLLQRTPQTLGDMFAFYYNLLDKWNSNDGHKRHAFVNAVQQANFGDTKTTLEISPLFGHTDHTSETHPNADLYSLVKCEYNGGDAALPCGPYLRPLVRDIYNTFSSKNASRYLSWVVYLTETFYDLLKKLYDECCEKCDKRGRRCHDKSCAEKCKVKYTDAKGEAITPQKSINHGKECSSIVKCPYTLSTLCRYGFYFESSWRMSGEHALQSKRTCRDLCRALEKVLSKKESDDAALATLIYKTIPNFLWNIRSKFFWTTVALWLLSLFYLLCVMVGRLDVLHIRSHLKIPSSHKITAQSLLAAAQVGRLAKISYLQP